MRFVDDCLRSRNAEIKKLFITPFGRVGIAIKDTNGEKSNIIIFKEEARKIARFLVREGYGKRERKR